MLLNNEADLTWQSIRKLLGLEIHAKDCRSMLLPATPAAGGRRLGGRLQVPSQGLQHQ